MYDIYEEFYFLKQLPFNIWVSIVNAKNIDKKEDIILVTYMEYHKKNNIELCGMPLGNKEIEFTPKKNNILIRIALGKFFVDNKTCNLIIDNSINNLTDFILNVNDMYDLIKDSENKTDENIDTKKIYLINKNGVFVYFKRTQNAFKIVKVVIQPYFRIAFSHDSNGQEPCPAKL
jgi:hypothetical protein